VAPEPLTAIETSTLREEAMLQLEAFTTSPSAELRTNSVEALSGIPSRVERAAAAGLEDPNQAVRFASAMVVGYDRISDLAGAVRPLLEDASPSVRAAAIFALVRCGARVDRSPLAVTLLDDPSPGHRANAAFVLGELGDPSALPMLREAVAAQMRTATEAEARLLRLQIAEAMIKLGDDSQLEAVRAALYPSRPDELEATALAVQVIGEVGDQAAVDQLIYLTAYREKGQMMPAEVRLAAAASLAKLGRPQGSPIAMEYVADERAVIRAQSAFVLGQTGRRENLRTLREMMGDESEIVRLTASGAVLDITSGPSPRAASSR
jgi:HEAT repeat protein